MRLIDADALIKKLGISERFNADIPAWVIGVIKGMPSAERKGRWIDSDKAVRWTCSECGRRDVHIYNYCPDCGARMIESEGENEQTIHDN